MAKQRSIIKLEGTIGDITFFKSRDGYLAKEISRVPKHRILNDPRFARTRENMQEFTRASQAAKLLRSALREGIQYAKDNRMVSRLFKSMMEVIKLDASSPRGQRNVIDGEVKLLEGFEFNINSTSDNTIGMAFATVLDRSTGNFSVILPDFVPTKHISAPEGTTHFKVHCCAAEVNFEDAVYVTEVQTGNILPYNDQTVSGISLGGTLPANSTHPLFLNFGVEFFQEVNGMKYSLNNGAFNSFAIVKVDEGV